MAVDLRKLRNAIEVARSGSITIAAENLHMTQSTLTRSIADLESDIGMLLFQRTPKGVIPTEVGLEFVSKAKPIMASVDGLIGDLKDRRDLRTGRLRIGFASAMFQPIVYPSILRMIRENPGLGMETSSGAGEAQVPKLVAGELDLLVGTEVQLSRWVELNLEPVVELHCKIMVRADHPLTQGEAVTPESVLSYPVVQSSSMELSKSEIHGVYRSHNLEPRDPKYLCEDFEQVRMIIENSDAFSLVFSPSGRFRSLEGRFALLDNVLSIAPQSLALATTSTRAPTPAALAFQDQVREHLNKSGRTSG